MACRLRSFRPLKSNNRTMTKYFPAVRSSIIRFIAGSACGVFFLAGAIAHAAPTNPILFVTQVPSLGDFTGRGSTFGNHMTAPDQVIRGGDLMIRYPNGALRNLTLEAGYGVATGFQGASAIAVREPTVHWSGTKAVFSMVVGAPPVQYNQTDFFWQLYEVTNLASGQTAVITKVANQPTGYNNVSPFYGTDDRILFTSDRPHNGQASLYPQVDEYESAPTVTGIWSLNPTTGDLRLLNHTPSGAFSPSIDSFGRVIFTRWDHLQRDQQADSDMDPDPNAQRYGSFNFASEAAGAAHLARSEMYPEPRADSVSAAYGPVNGHRFNQFTPWAMNEDGTDEETMNHIGRHEFSFGYLIKSFASDNKLSDYSVDSLHANNFSIGMDTGLFHMREDPLLPGSYLGVYTREFATLTSGQIFRLSGAPTVNPDNMTLTAQTATAGTVGGRFRNPLPLSSGDLVASHTLASGLTPDQMGDFRMKLLTRNVGTGFFEAGAPLTAGIVKSVSWWTPDSSATFTGPLWEIEAVEVVARPRPSNPALPLEQPEHDVFAEVGVNEAAFRAWLAASNLAVIVTRNQTSRDQGDKLQPFNLHVPGGVQTVAPGGGKVYDITHFQILQGDLIRGYDNREGRRVIAQPLHEASARNVANAGGPVGSVKIASDGSTAAFVPARRALAWQSTDAAGEPVIRERVWVTFQPGEVRVCASCHGVNTKNQANADTPVNKPEALRTLLTAWLASQSANAGGDDDGDGIPNGVEAFEARNAAVKDNDVFANARLFAMQQYRDFLNREGDAAGIQGWTDAVTTGAFTRLQVVDAFLSSQEFSGFVAPVVRLYFATFLRVPDYAGLTFNAGLVRNATITVTQLADFFTQSPEFMTTYGALNNTQFVTLLYNNVLNRAPDTGGLNGWVQLLTTGGYTRGQVLLGFSDSPEYQASSANKVFVSMMYTGMLHRTPEPGGFNGWVSLLDNATYTRSQVINGFFLSTEYHNRFLP
jgi:Domain of unknown function (DUF4214)/Hydrazine synthase alpha subunit middle domain